MSAPSAVVYVYYKVDAAEHAACALRVRQCQAALAAQWPDLACELLQRPEASSGIETWMETYRHRHGLSPALLNSIASEAVAAGLPAPRHTETFIPLRE